MSIFNLPARTRFVKLFVVALFIMSMPFIGNAASKYWIGTTNVAWTTTTAWSNTSGGASCGCTPAAGDDVFIGGTATTAITAVPTITLRSLNVRSGGGASVSLTGASAGRVITLDQNISGVLVIDNSLTLASNLSITTSGQLSASGSIAATKVFAVGANSFTWNTGGLFTNNGGAAGLTVTSGNITFNYAGSQTIPALQVNGAGKLILAGSGTKTLNISISIGATGTLSLQGTATTAGSAPSYTAGASLEYNGTNQQTMSTSELSSATTGINLIVNNLNATPKVTLDQSRTINNLTMTAGKLAIGGNTLTINGQCSSMSLANSLIGSSSSNLSFGGSGITMGTVFFDQTSPATRTLQDLTINRSLQTLTLGASSPLIVGGTFALTAGTFSPGANSVTLTGAGACFTGAGTLTPGTSTFIYSGSGAQTINPTTYRNLTIDGDRSFANITLGSGTIGVAGILSLSYFNVSSIVNASNTVNFNGAVSAQTIPSTAFTNFFRNLSISNSLGVTVGSSGGSTMTILGNLNVSSGRLNDGGNQIAFGTAGSTITLAASTYLQIGTSSYPTDYPTTNVSTHSLAASSTVEYNSINAQDISNVPVYGNLDLINTATNVTKKLIGNTTVQGTVSIASNNTLNLNNFTLSIAGTPALSNNGIINASAANSRIKLNGTGAQTLTIGTYTSSIVSTLEIDNTDNTNTSNSGARLASALNVKDMVINASRYFNFAGQTLSVSNTWTNNGTVVTALPAGTGTLNFNGNANQQLTFGAVSAPANPNLSVLQVSITSPGTQLTLNGDVKSAGLNLTSGKIITSASPSKMLILTGTGVIAGSPGTTSYVEGPMQRTVPASSTGSTTLLYPLGKAGNYNPFALAPKSGAGGTTLVQAEVFNTNLSGTSAANFSNSSLARYWAASVIGTNNLTVGSQVSLYDPSITTADVSLAVGYATTASCATTCAFTNVGGVNPNNPANSVTSSLGLPAAIAGNFVIGTKNCLNGPTYTVGATGDYANITAVINDLNASLICANLTFKLQSTYVSTAEIFPLTFGTYLYGAGGPFTVTFMPDDNSNGNPLPVITSTNTTATISFDKGSRVIFDGRQGGNSSFAKKMTITNTSTNGRAVLFINDAQYNRVQYCVLTASGTNTAAGIVSFSTSNGTLGNDYNTIDNNDITASSTITNNGVYSAGQSTSIFNDNNRITNNNISNFFNSSGQACGVYVGNYNSNWLIQGNKFFQTTTRTMTGAVQPHAVISIDYTGTGSGGYEVRDNIIGGIDANGTGVMTYTSGVGPNFTPIYLNVASSPASIIDGNTVHKLAYTTTSGATADWGAFSAIYLRNGAATISNNNIGSTGAGNGVTVTITNSGGYVNGIKSDAAGTVNINNNNVVNMLAIGSGTNTGINLFALSAGNGSTTIENNEINGASLQINSTATTNGSVLGGINTTYTVAGYSPIVRNNKIYNLTNANTGSSTRVAGIIAGGASAVSITGNEIYNLTTPATGTSNGTSSAVIGILANVSGTNAHLVSGNKIYALTSTAAVNSVTTGIYFSGGSATSDVSKNFIYNLRAGTGTASVINGIHVGLSGVTISNNRIRLGYDAAGAAITNTSAITGILKDNTSASNSIYYNSVYIGGTGVGTTATATYAFRRLQTGTNDIVRNNIFVNARANATTGGKHYGVFLNNTTTLTEDNNLIYTTGTGTVFASVNGTDQADLTAWKAATPYDDNSVSADPQFEDPTNATAPNLKLKTNVATPAESSGVNISGLIDDFEAVNVRTGYPLGLPQGGTAPDLGADEANLIPLDMVAPAITISPVANITASCGTSQTVTITATVTDATGVASGSLAPTLWWRLSTGTYASLAPSSVSGSTYTYQLNLTGVAAGQTYHYYIAAQDIVTPFNIGYSHGAPVHTNVAATPSTINAAPATFTVAASALSGTVSVGTGQTYTTLTGTGGLFAAINANGLNGNLLVNVVSNTAETGLNGLLQWTEYCGSGYTLTVQSDGPVRTLSGAYSSDLLIRINGADRVTFNGGSGTQRNLVLINTNNSFGTFGFLDGCVDGKINNCDIQNNGSGIQVYTANVGGVAANVTIENCTIHNYSTSIGVYGIYADNPLAAVTITGNWVYNYNSAGIALENVANNAVITGNSCTQPDFNIGIGTGTIYGIYVNYGNGHTITGNLIGGSTITGGGLPYTVTSNGKIVAIYYDAFGAPASAVVTNISGNTIQNMAMTSTNAPTFVGIEVEGGVTNVGQSGSPNIIGNASSTLGITVGGASATGGSVARGILSASPDRINISYNTIANIKDNNTNTTAGSCSGIKVASVGANSSIDHNTIYEISTSSRNDYSTVWNVLGDINYGYQFALHGIQANAVAGGNVNLNISDNTIYNLKCTSTSTAQGPDVAAISVDLGNGTIARNKIYGLTNTTSFDNYTLVGTIDGIRIVDGPYDVYNNQIIITNGANTNNVQIYGIHDASVNYASKYYYNSVYVGGNTTTGNNGWSACFLASTIMNSVVCRNNIFYNVRTSTGSATSANLGVYVRPYNGGTPNFNTDYNNYYVPAANYYGGVLTSGYGGITNAHSTFAGWKNAFVTPREQNSQNAQITFSQGTPTSDLSPASGSNCLIDGKGTPITTGAGFSLNIADDYLLATRNASTPDIGAIEFAGSTITASVTLTDNSNANSSTTSLSVCGTPSYTASVSTNAGGTPTYTWSTPDSYAAGSVSSFTRNAALAMAGTHAVTVTDAGGCSATASAALAVTATCGPNTWQGDVVATPTDWFNAGNWSANVVPNSCASDVVIPTNPSGGNFFPIINAAGAQVGNITVQAGATVGINSTRTLTVCGNWTGSTTATPSTVTGAGKVVLTGNAAQAITGRTTFTTLHVSKTAGTTATVQASSNIDVTTALELETGILANSGNLT
ncbi:MAG TPA: hypothetical protein VK174_09905, partial [Chitinophagales bacterium]|nr:hypothetical protein [Chitinophagales bacterium]